MGVLLWQGSELLGNLNNVCDPPTVRLGVGESFRFVADEVVSVRNNAVELVLEELRDKRSGK